MSGTIDAHKAIVRRFVAEVRNKGNLALLNELVVAEKVDELRAQSAGLRESFTDYHVTIEDVIGDGDTVVLSAMQSGTQVGPIHGIPATGKAVRWRVLRVFKFRDGKIAETYALGDVRALLDQLQARIVVD